MWQDWAVGVLGLWVIIVPFLGISGSTLAWTVAVTGIVIAAIGFWMALGRPSAAAR